MSKVLGTVFTIFSMIAGSLAVSFYEYKQYMDRQFGENIPSSASEAEWTELENIPSDSPSESIPSEPTPEEVSSPSPVANPTSEEGSLPSPAVNPTSEDEEYDQAKMAQLSIDCGLIHAPRGMNVPNGGPEFKTFAETYCTELAEYLNKFDAWHGR